MKTFVLILTGLLILNYIACLYEVAVGLLSDIGATIQALIGFAIFRLFK